MNSRSYRKQEIYVNKYIKLLHLVFNFHLALEFVQKRYFVHIEEK